MAFEDYSVKLAFARIEDELIDSMMRNLRRHLQEEKDEGFDWSQWQVEQLKYLEEYRRKNKKKFGPQFADINQRMQEAIQDAAERGQKDEEIRILQDLAGNKKIQRRYANQRKASIEAQGDAFFRINDNKLEALLTATQNDMEKAEHAVLRRANDQYRKIIFDAQVYANTGAGTVEKAVDMAAKDFLSHGIDSIEYKNGSRHTIKDYADMYIRTAERRAYLMGEGNKRKEWGMSLVLVNKRGSMRDGSYGTACPQCIPWLGKVLIDDVYSGGEPDGKHKLLSEAMAAGFLHPRCKDVFTTYFPGISSAPDPDATKKELKAAAEAEKEEVKENYVDRQEEKYERLAEYSLDSDNQRKYEARRKEWRERQAGRKEENEKQLIRGINADGASTLAQAYDRRRERYGLNLITGEQMLNNPFGNAVVDYTGVSVETAQAFNKTLEDLQEEYLSGITEIKVAEKKEVFGATFFARVEADDRIGRRVLIINPHKCQDLNSMVERIRELSAKGHCVKIPEGMEAEYVATHEFAHGLLNMQEHRKSLIGMDWRTTNKASREIKAMYQEYMDEIRSIEAEISELRKQPALSDFSASAEEQMEAFRKLKEAQDRLSSVRISKYSMENADEFMAEAFTQHRIGVSQNKYSERVMEVLDREYKLISDNASKLRNNIPHGFIDTRVVGEPISEEKLKAFLNKAASKGIRIGADSGSTGNFELYCGDPDVLDEILDRINSNMKEAKRVGLLKQDDDIILIYDNVLGYKGDRSAIDIGAFALTKGKTITLNKFMFDSTKTLIDEYEDALMHELFPRGTSFKNVVDHEFGHILDKHNSFLRKRILAILKEKADNDKISLEEYVSKRISMYAAAVDRNGNYTYGELISELYNMLKGTEPDFARELFRKAGVLL